MLYILFKIYCPSQNVFGVLMSNGANAVFLSYKYIFQGKVSELKASPESLTQLPSLLWHN